MKARIPLDRCIQAVLRFRWLVLALSTLVMLALAAGTGSIQVANSYRTLFNEDDPRLLAFDALEDTYAKSNAVLIAVAPKAGSVFTREALVAIEELTEAAWKTPYSNRVDSLTNYIHSRAKGDELVVGPLVEGAGAFTDAVLAETENVALNAVELKGSLVSADGRVAGVVVNLILPERSEPAEIEIKDYLDALLDQARTSHPEIEYYLTGYVIVNRAFSEATAKDIETLLPIAVLVILALTAILLRSGFGTVAILVVMVFSVGSAMGFAGWSEMVFSPPSAGVPLIVLTIAIADSIHIVAAALQAMRRGLDKNAAIAESLRINAAPVFLTSLTTAIGFLSLNASDAPPFHVLGNCVAFGVLCALVYSLTLLPALLSVLPLRASPVRSRRTDLFDRFGEWVVARRGLLLWSMPLAAAVLLSGIPRIEFGDSLTKYFDDRYQVRRDSDFIAENLTGLDKLEYSMDSGRENGITELEYLRTLDSFAEWFRRQPGVVHVEVFSDIMKRLNKNLHGDDPDFHRLPDEGDMAAQYLLLYEFSLPLGSDLYDRINFGRSATRMAVTVMGATSRDLRAIDSRAQAWLHANSPSFAQEASGLSMIVAHMTQQNVVSMLKGAVIAMGLISFILIWVFRSIPYGLVSLVPNFVPALMTFGLWGHLVGSVGIAASVIVSIAFGVVVDDTIHFLSKYLKARREGCSSPEAVRVTFRTVGHALWTTTAALSAGFLVFAASGFETSWTLGVLVTITILFALAADFLLLPALLMTFDRKKM